MGSDVHAGRSRRVRFVRAARAGDQRPIREQCEAILARAATAAEPEPQVKGEASATERALLDVLDAARLVNGARLGTTALSFTQVRDPADRRLTIERAIPLRGALRRGRAFVAALIVGAALVGLAWLSPWLLLVPPALLAASFNRWFGRWFTAAHGAIHVFQLKPLGERLAERRSEDAERRAEDAQRRARALASSSGDATR